MRIQLSWMGWAALALTACTTPPPPQTPPTSELRPQPPVVEDDNWTQEFMKPAVLIATDVRIEGPPGLLAHVATLQDPARHRHFVRTLPQGLYQETVVLAEAGFAPIKCHLDNMEIAAEHRLQILERPSGDTVTVVANGEVYWSSDGAERRAETLTLVGNRPATTPASAPTPEPVPSH